MSLQEFLSKLNSNESNWKIWVDPENPCEKYTTVQEPGRIEGWVCIGSFDRLSFGYQSEEDAFFECIDFVMQKKAKHYNPSSLFKAYRDGYVGEDLAREISRQIELIHDEWSQFGAEEFIADILPDLIQQYNQDVAC